MTRFDMLGFIEKKRDGGRHSEEDFNGLVSNAMSGKIPDYQLSAWLMAAFLNGLDREETAFFTKALAFSGDRYDFPPDMRVVDKHSTGGVGDKTTLVLLPLAAVCGATVSKLSGPGLGFTGGTVDKFESVPGMRMRLETEEFLKESREIGCAVSGHSARLAPAEGIFYKLRDVTGTVPSVPLITASIISKKLAGGASCFVFDVKCGRGAFMKEPKAAKALAESLVGMSKFFGKKSSAVITDMNEPLGEWVGNSMEVFEATEVLRGKGPADTRELCVALCAQMLAASGIAKDAKEGAAMACAALDNGAALKKFKELVAYQGGDARVAEAPLEILPVAKIKIPVVSESTGFIAKMDALAVGEALRRLGGGRTKLDDKIDPAAAIRVLKKTGDEVKAGEPILELCLNDFGRVNEAAKYISSAWEVSEEPQKKSRGVIMDYVTE